MELSQRRKKNILEQTREAAPLDLEHRRELVNGFVKGRVSVIMPAYNEAEHIWNSVADVEKQFGNVLGDYEVIVVNDGSTDGTEKLVQSLESEKVRIVSYDRNEGKGHAFRKGFCRATGEFTFLVDSDAEIRARDLSAYIGVLSSADIAIGSKRHPDSVVRTPVIRRFLSLGFNILERLTTGVKVGDTQAGFKAAKSQVLYQVLPLLTAKRYCFDLELLAVASLLRFNIKELPVCIDLKGSFDLRHVFRMMIDVFGIAYRLKLTRWYQKNILNMSDTYYPMIKW